jgi:hypothetical protein
MTCDLRVQCSDWTARYMDRIVGHLTDLINIDTTSPREEQAFPYLSQYLSDVGFLVREEPLAAHSLRIRATRQSLGPL